MTPTVEISRKLNLVEPSQSRMGRLGRLARDRSPPLWPAKLAVPDRLGSVDGFGREHRLKGEAGRTLDRVAASPRQCEKEPARCGGAPQWTKKHGQAEWSSRVCSCRATLRKIPTPSGQ